MPDRLWRNPGASKSLPIRLTRRNIVPTAISAAAVQQSTVRFTQAGTGTVRADRVCDYPVLLADLKILRLETDQFGAWQAASNQDRKDCSVTFGPEALRRLFLQQASCLLDCQASSNLDSGSNSVCCGAAGWTSTLATAVLNPTLS
jgi:hypothetical protein